MPREVINPVRRILTQAQVQANRQPQPPAEPWKQTQEIGRQATQIGQVYRNEAPPGAFPAAISVPPRAVPAPQYRPPTPAPATSEAAMDRLVAAVTRQVAVLERIAAQNDLILRMNWINFASNTAISPTNPELPILGSSGANYTGATYLGFYKNIREYPIGIVVTAEFTTPGAWLKLSLNQGDNGKIADLQNGGPNGGVITNAILLNPGQTIYAANKDALIPLTANDIFRVRVLDVANNLKTDVFRMMPYVVGK